MRPNYGRVAEFFVGGVMSKSLPAVISVLVSSLAPVTLYAQSPVGSEFQVNTYTTSFQSQPSVASDPSGNFVVVWTSREDGSDDGVFGQRFASTGSALGTEFQVNTYTTDEESRPSVATDSGGNFVVVWESGGAFGVGQDGSYSGVFGQRFASSGSALGTEFQVNTHTAYFQGSSAVSSDPSGNFVVVWASAYQDDPFGTGVFGQRFASDGSTLGTEFHVNTYTTASQGVPSVATDSSGNFVVVWASFGAGLAGQDGSYGGIFGQRFASSGGALGSEFQINSYTTGDQLNPSVATDPSGNFVVAWQSDPQGGVFGQRFASDGSALGSEFQVSTYTTYGGFNPRVATDVSGNFVVAWHDLNHDGSSFGVFGQLFASDGSALGSEFRVNTYTNNSQRGPSVATEPSGNFVVVWQSYTQDGSQDGVFGQRFAPGPPATATPTATSTSTPTPTDTPTTVPTDTPTPTPSVFGCPPTPLGSCRTAGKSLLSISNKLDDTQDKLLWKWIKGQSTSIADFGDPTSTTQYAICVYHAGGPVLSAIVPPTFWTASGSGFKYKDPSTSNAGITKIILKASDTNNTKIVLKGEGINLPDPTLMLTAPVTAQLINSDTAVCFTADYSGAQIHSNTDTLFKGKAP